MLIGNVGYLQAGMPLLPDAAIDDGVLDVVLLHPSRFLSWIPLAVRVLSKGRRTDDLINRMTGRDGQRPGAAPTPRGSSTATSIGARPRAARRVRARQAAGPRPPLSRSEFPGWYRSDNGAKRDPGVTEHPMPESGSGVGAR